MVTRNTDSFIPTRINIVSYGRVTADGTFTFTGFAREDDYIEDKKLWKQELASTVKEWNKFINDAMMARPSTLPSKDRQRK